MRAKNHKGPKGKNFFYYDRPQGKNQEIFRKFLDIVRTFFLGGEWNVLFNFENNFLQPIHHDFGQKEAKHSSRVLLIKEELFPWGVL